MRSSFKPDLRLPAELVENLLNARSSNAKLNAYTSLTTLEDAAQMYDRAPYGPLHGFGVAVKDIFCTKDALATTAASNMLQKYHSPMESIAVKRLKEAGAVLIGKTNMDEFGMGSASIYSCFGPTLNPVQQQHSHSIPSSMNLAGGSSGGSAAAVASRTCRIALASDTGGSTRLPSAYCGVFGLKPSYGLISRRGMLAYSSSLDCVGIIGRNVSDILLALGKLSSSNKRDSAVEPVVFMSLGALSVFDGQDPTSASPTTRVLLEAQNKAWKASRGSKPLENLRVGIPIEFFSSDVSPIVMPAYRRVLSFLRSKGALLSSISIPSVPLALGAYYIIASSEASSNLARYDGVRFGGNAGHQHQCHFRSSYSQARSTQLGREVQKRILLGTYALSVDAYDSHFLQAQRIRLQLQMEFNQNFSMRNPLSGDVGIDSAGVDVIVHPSTINVAPSISEAKQTSSFSHYVQDILNVPASLAGLPAITVPSGFAKNGLPVGIQIAGQWGSDEIVLQIADAISHLRQSELGT